MRFIKLLLGGLSTILVLSWLMYNRHFGSNWRIRQRWQEVVLQSAPPGSISEYDETPPAGMRRKTGSTEKYLTFYPHSGLHNQRLGLLNALVLAKALDRTLIVPDLNLGKGVFWAASPLLAYRIGTCIDTPASERKGECYYYRRYIPLPTTQVFDLSALDALGIRWIERTDMHPSYLDAAFRPEEMYALNDSTRLSYRIYDTRNNTQELLQFEYRVDLEDLAARDEPLMVFGSLFSTSRLVLNYRPDLLWLRDYLSGEVGFNNPIVVRQALDVASKLGGPGTFASVHLRTGDGVFRVTMAATMAKMRETLQNQLGNDDTTIHDEVVDRITALSQRAHGRTDALLRECLLAQQANGSSDGQRQRQRIHPRLRMIFMATDAAEPRKTLSNLFDEFVCMFTLSDFRETIDQTISSSERYGALFLPLIDAEIATFGDVFVGTRKSTFSKYIQFRNRRFLAHYPAIRSTL